MENSKNYLLTESLLNSVSIYMILKRLMSDFKDWDAYKLGIIDANGKKLKSPITYKERESWDILTRFCWNLKKVTTTFIGKSKFASYFTAAYLLKDSLSMFYITKNKSKLDETLLNDITFTKQLILYNAIKQFPVLESVEDNIEFYLYKHFEIIFKLLEEHKEIYNLFGIINEEGEGVAPAPAPAGGTVAADIAQYTPRLGAVQSKKTKAKKKKPRVYKKKQDNQILK